MHQLQSIRYSVAVRCDWTSAWRPFNAVYRYTDKKYLDRYVSRRAYTLDLYQVPSPCTSGTTWYVLEVHDLRSRFEII